MLRKSPDDSQQSSEEQGVVNFHKNAVNNVEHWRDASRDPESLNWKQNLRKDTVMSPKRGKKFVHSNILKPSIHEGFLKILSNLFRNSEKYFT